MNNNKLFTINSQPHVNGVPSTDPKYGWGPKYGYVYQKAYYEFFIPKELLEPLIAHLEKDPMITYQAINALGDDRLNVSKDDVNAVTWGVFKGKCIYISRLVARPLGHHIRVRLSLCRVPEQVP